MSENTHDHDSDEARLARHRDLHRTVPREVSEARRAADAPVAPHLVTPRDWQAQAQREANEVLGTFEGAAKLAEAKRYGALADELERLRVEAAQWRYWKPWLERRVDLSKYHPMDASPPDTPGVPVVYSKSVVARLATQMGLIKDHAEPSDHWTITAPDGRQWTGPSAFRVASTAHKASMTDDQISKLMETLRIEREEYERLMQLDHEHLNCPACGGSGHVDDTKRAP